MKEIFRPVTSALIVCVLVGATLHVVLLASDSPEYRGWVYVQMALLALAAWLLWHVRKLSRPALAALVAVTIPIAYINAVELNYGNGPVLWLIPVGFWGIYGLLALYAPDGFRRESKHGV